MKKLTLKEKRNWLIGFYEHVEKPNAEKRINKLSDDKIKVIYDILSK